MRRQITRAARTAQARRAESEGQATMRRRARDAGRELAYTKKALCGLTLELSGRCRVPHDNTEDRRSGPLERIVRAYSPAGSRRGAVSLQRPWYGVVSQQWLETRPPMRVPVTERHVEDPDLATKNVCCEESRDTACCVSPGSGTLSGGVGQTPTLASTSGMFKRK